MCVQKEKKTSAQLALEKEAKRISGAARRAKMHAVHVNISGSFSGSY
jgi:fatty acid-binding protein DegV